MRNALDPLNLAYGVRRFFPLLALLGCTGPTAVPLPPEPSAQEFGVFAVGWDSDSAAIWVPEDSRPINLAEEKSLHWLALSETSVASSLPADSQVTLTNNPELGGPLPISVAHRLVEDPDKGLIWQPVAPDNFDPEKHFFPSFDKDFEACRELDGCYAQGGCSEVCDQSVVDATAIAAPQLPELTCPSDWVDIGTNGDQFCFPPRWIEAGVVSPKEVNRNCGPGQLDAGGGCVPFSPCPTSDFPQVASDGRPLIYVNPAAAAGGSGAMNQPFQEVPAFDRSAVVVLSKGRHDLGSRVLGQNQDIDLVGACAASVDVVGSLVVENAQVRLRGLSLKSDAVALTLRDGRLDLEEVFIEGDEHALVQNGGTTSSTLARFETNFVEPGNENFAVRIVGGSFHAERNLIVGHVRQLGGRAKLHNSAVVQIPREDPLPDNAPGTLTIVDGQTELRNLRVHSELRYGVFVIGGDVDASDLFVTSRSRSCVAVDGSEINLNIQRIAAVGMPRMSLITASGAELRPGSLRIYGGVVEVTDLAGAGFPSGVVVNSFQAEDPQQLSLRRIWLRWDGEPGIWTREITQRLLVEDAWLNGRPQVGESGGPLLGTDNGVFKLEAGEVVGSRIRMRPLTRHAFVLEERTSATFEDILISGEHGRSFYINSGTKAVFRRVTGTEGSGGVLLFGSGRPFDPRERTVTVSDVRLQLMQQYQYSLAGNGLPFMLERFDVWGSTSVDPEFPLPSVQFTNGRLEEPPGADVWPPGFVGRFQHVFVSTHSTP